mmetsp:Transcript_54450/g.132144  ORF Transcript_54450/g.132144 Transcript_54450/m.132144 type:complete len:277 (-) Transcript_54450:501-1331(-)|eukprot:CAMPEP_0113458904 /NCGR_PEP_ID=MMETSP0014_2-20120614/10164_1 /TAXON_ID=2857 /ORGANISM="Nitzschia sp." /LENGTH=276 /DNA_ID=CAMNT_0000350445 /DNA_START=232 /DNA_END=1062 /DNA_ORIENTATION=+ /assembly_acc=CAM_ASM_000159
MAQLITATVVKEERSSKLGIAFEREGEGKALRVKLIREDSLFAGSELVPGMIVVEAAGIDMVGKTPKDAADAMRGAPGGEEVSLVCKATFSSTAMPESEPETKKAGRFSFRKKASKKKTDTEPPKLGISFKSSTAQPGKIFVGNIKEDSKFASTNLKVGHQVIAISGVVCPDNVTDAVALLKEKQASMVDDLVLVTIDPEDEVVPILEQKEGPQPVSDVVEEKKEDFPQGDDEDDAASEKDIPKDPSAVEKAKTADEEEDTTPEANMPGLLSWCIC